MAASKKLSPATLAAYETVLASAQFCEPLGDEAVVQISLPALNDLLRLVGLPDIEDEGPPPAHDDVGQEKVQVADAGRGEATNETHWSVGSIAEINELEGVAVISCPAIEEQFSKQVFANLDDVRKEFRGDLTKQVGAEVMFQLKADADDNLFAGPPLFAKTRSFTGAISAWRANFGFLKCPELDALFADGVYIHGNAAAKGNVPTNVGQKVTFQLHVSDKGKPQASSPKPAGGGIAAMSASRPSPYQQPLAKGGDPWGASLGPDSGKGFGAFKGKDSWGKDSWGKGGAKAPWGGMAELGWAKGGKGLSGGGKAGKGGEDWYEGTVSHYGKEKGFGFIAGSSFGEDVYVHTNVVESCGAYEGAFVQFKVHMSKQGKPQASSPMFVL